MTAYLHFSVGWERGYARHPDRVTSFLFFIIPFTFFPPCFHQASGRQSGTECWRKEDGWVGASVGEKGRAGKDKRRGWEQWGRGQWNKFGVGSHRWRALGAFPVPLNSLERGKAQGCKASLCWEEKNILSCFTAALHESFQTPTEFILGLYQHCQMEKSFS